MASKPKRESAVSSLAVDDSSSDPKKVCLIISHMEKPVAYEIYLIDARDIGCNSSSRISSSRTTDDNDNDWTKQQMQILTPAIELPSNKYPICMGFFNVGSRVYLVGGERVTASSHTRSEKNTHLDRSVYVCDTSSPPPLSVKPARRMNGGKCFPSVSPVNGKFYVLSHHPTQYTHFTIKTPLFECFEPNAERWSVLPNPPFYDYGEYHYCGYPGVVQSNTVVGAKIFFYTTHKHCLYAFDTDCSEWKTFNLFEHKWQDFPFRRGATVSIRDYCMWFNAGYHYPLTAHALIPNEGLVSKEVEGLTTVLTCHPSLSYAVQFHVLDSKNEWFCVLKSGCHAEPYAGGKPSLLACMFRLVENHKDMVAAFEVYPFPSHDKSPALEKGAFPDYERIVGKMSVLAAADVRCSLFKVESKHFEWESCFATSFLLWCDGKPVRWLHCDL